LRGPEGKYIDKVHRQLDKYLTPKDERLIYRQKMNMAPGSPCGTPDLYYESNPTDLWVEYKTVNKWEGKRTIPVSKITENQLKWLTRAVNNNQQCAVIFGAPNGQGIILIGKEIFNPPDLASIPEMNPVEVANWIKMVTTS